jgi:hypothetical protein
MWTTHNVLHSVCVSSGCDDGHLAGMRGVFGVYGEFPTFGNLAEAAVGVCVAVGHLAAAGVDG